MTDSTVRIRLVTHLVDASTSPRHGAELPGSVQQLQPLHRRVEHRGEDQQVMSSSVTTRVQGARLDVVLSGDVDQLLCDELALVLEEAEQHCRTHPRATVHVDVREVSAVDTTAVRFVEQLRRRSADQGGRCTLSSSRPAVRKVLALAQPISTGELAVG